MREGVSIFVFTPDDKKKLTVCYSQGVRSPHVCPARNTQRLHPSGQRQSHTAKNKKIYTLPRVCQNNTHSQPAYIYNLNVHSSHFREPTERSFSKRTFIQHPMWLVYCYCNIHTIHVAYPLLSQSSYQVIKKSRHFFCYRNTRTEIRPIYGIVVFCSWFIFVTS